MFLIDLDLRELTRTMRGMEESIKRVADEEGRNLSAAVHAHILEQANEQLSTRRDPFVKALSYTQENENTWLITLDKSARWIDDGLEPHEMIDDLLSSRGTSRDGRPGPRGRGPQRAADGSMYRVIPFRHGPGKGPTNSTPAQQSLTATIKKALKSAHNEITGKKGIPYGKIEKGEDGKPLHGLLHKLDIMHEPKKTHHGPGQGWGAVGDVRQGPTGIPFLQGVRIYQHETGNPDGSRSTKRAIMTFRVVSSKHKGTGRWFHPGLQPVYLMEEGWEWGMKQWEEAILPRIIERVTGGG